MTIYDFVVKDNKGNEVPLENYRGKVLLIVNTATGCGFTPQYDGLQNLYDRYAPQGFEILDFPCNQFLGQAPGTSDEIAEFCKGRFGITFKQFGKIKVNGKDAEPLYEYLKSQKGGVLGKRIKWNFTKFLVGKDGTVLSRFAPTVKPEEMEEAIKEALQ